MGNLMNPKKYRITETSGNRISVTCANPDRLSAIIDDYNLDVSSVLDISDAPEARKNKQSALNNAEIDINKYYIF